MPRESAKPISHFKGRRPPSKPPRRKPSGSRASIYWDEAVRRYLDHLLGPAEASRHTILHYGHDLKAFHNWWRTDSARAGEELEPAAVLPSDLRDYKDWLRLSPIDQGTPRERTRKAGAVNAALAPVKSFLLWCEGAGIIAEAPEMPKRVKTARPPHKAIHPHDQKRLLRTVERGANKRDMAIFLVLLDCGLRVAELCALSWRDVNLIRGRSELYIWHGKGDKEAAVPLSRRARVVLLALRGDDADGDAPVFASRKGGKAITPRGIQKLFERYGRLAGVQASPHQCRHSCAKDMLDRGEQVPTVQAVLRHRSVITTLGYCTSSPDQVRRAVERGDDTE